MELILPLLGLGILSSFVVLPFVVYGLSKRVRALEAALQMGARMPSVTSAPQVATSSPVYSAPHPARPAQPTAGDKFIAWMQEDWLLKLGGLLLLIGFGWLATYAFLNNWIGPMGRIALGITLGSAILAFGAWRIRSFVHQGGVFLVVGSTTILLTVFAAREYYNFFTPFSALAIMFLASACVALASIKHNAKSLSIASIVLASIAPLLTNSGTTDYVSLFAYLLVVTLGTVWIVSVTGQRAMTSIALIILSIYSIPAIDSGDDASTLLLFAYAFAAIFFATNTFGILKLKGKDIVPDTIIAAGNGLFLLTWIVTGAPENWQSLIIVAWMLVFVAGALAVFKLTGRREPFFVYAGVGVAMLATATAVELEGAALTIAFTIETAAIVLLTEFLVNDRKATASTCFLFAGPMLLSLSSLMSGEWYYRVFHDDFFVLLTLSAALLGLGLYLRQRAPRDVHLRETTPTLLVIGSVYAYALLWLSLHAAFHNDDQAVMLSLLAYTIVGLISYFYGRTRASKPLGMYGGILLGFVVLRLLLVDVWDMAITGRIITFFVIGALLMSTAFFGRAHTASSHKS